MKIHLAEGVSLPLDIITMRSLVLGVSGSGKSTFARLLAEKIHEAGQRFCVIDLKNDWWGLKSSADGRSPAIPVVVIGGPRADVPLDENAGATVADIVAETPNSFIIDLDALSKGKGIRFLGSFLERLYDVNREPLLLICDEADRYAPQKPMSVEANVTLGAADDIARRGRKRGIGSLWLSQRPAVIAKNVTSQCELVITFRTSSSLDLKELREHIGRVASSEQVTETMNQVAGLRDGQAILMSQHPHTRMFTTAQFPMPATFDSSATPRVGHRRVEPKQLAAPDLAALDQRIQAAVEKAKAEDPNLLRARIKDLEKSNAQMQRELQMKSDLRSAPTKTKPAMTEADWKRLERFVARISAAKVDVEKFFGDWRIAIDGIAAKLAPARDREAILPIARSWTGIPGVPIVQKPVRILVERARGDIGQGKLDGNGTDLPRGARAMLASVVAFGSLDRQSIATLSGLASSGGTFLKYLSMLKTGGYLVSDDGEKFIPGGVNVGLIGGDGPPSDKRELVALWSHLPAGARAMLEVVVSREVVSRSELGELANIEPNGGTFAKYASMLVSAGLVERSGGSFKLSATMEMLP